MELARNKITIRAGDRGSTALQKKVDEMNVKGKDATLAS